ncbi:hypothetical protein FKW77_000603 [Venturia effusa]|uniref:ShKT domain-containing protein n=1 Tax=Venturia effusa TaxID=50376 RepID=A0A517LEX9_9PEZI|nr:hypothetical protein FKW77_000603 [Venturia effusa]
MRSSTLFHSAAWLLLGSKSVITEAKVIDCRPIYATADFYSNEQKDELSKCVADFAERPWGCASADNDRMCGGKYWSSMSQFWKSTEDCAAACSDCLQYSIIQGWGGVLCESEKVFARVSHNVTKGRVFVITKGVQCQIMYQNVIGCNADWPPVGGR